MGKTTLDKWQEDIMAAAFSRCWGLRDLAIKAVNSNDKMFTDAVVKAIAKQTAFSEPFVRENLQHISEL